MYTNLETGNACKKTPFSALVILTTAVIIKMSKLELQLLIYSVWQTESFTPEWEFTENNYFSITQVFELENLQCFTVIKKNRRPSRYQTYIHPRTVISTRSLLKFFFQTSIDEESTDNPVNSFWLLNNLIVRKFSIIRKQKFSWNFLALQNIWY